MLKNTALPDYILSMEKINIKQMMENIMGTDADCSNLLDKDWISIGTNIERKNIFCIQQK